MKLSAPVAIMRGGVKQGSFGGEVAEIDFDEVQGLAGTDRILYCVHALSSLTIDEAADVVIDLVDAIEEELVGL